MRISSRLNNVGLTRRGLPRRAAVGMELLIVIPVMLISLFAIVQFGIYFTRLQALSLAARDGAKRAAETPGLPTSGTVPVAITHAIEQQLMSCGIQPCAVILEHNVGGAASLRTDYSPACPTCGPSPMAPVLPASSVRITICVPFTQMMPNALESFGFDVEPYNAQRATTYPYEL